MKKTLLTATIFGVAVMTLMGKSNAKDPVVMTVDGRDVKLSEFEYLYNKNNNQQLTPLTFDEYVDMFVNYKLKVADALNARLDTTPAFKAEFDKFRHELAQPYLNDPLTAEEQVQEAYSHTAEDVYVSHIMLPLDPESEVRIDSIREEILADRLSFEDAAREFSVDRGSSRNGGRMGWVTGLSQFPWTFEKASYDTPVGMISEVVNSGVGYHLVRPEERRPCRGEVLAEHILVLTQGLDEAGAAHAKAKIDSIYTVVTTPGVDFGEVAKRESEDPGSAQAGGRLDWFGSGRMVAQFDSVAFALPDGAISQPFATRYGYHIIHKLDHRGQRSLDELRPAIEQAIQRDERAQMPRRATLNKVAAQTGAALAPDYLNAVKAIIEANDELCDTAVINQIKICDVRAYNAPGGAVVTLGEALAKAPLRPAPSPEAMLNAVERYVNNAYDAALVNAKLIELEANEPAYSNLVNEYRDGILLFDISNDNVWDRASKDTEGLKAYFDDNREKYCTWTSPKYKAYIIFAQNDSTLSEIKAYLDANYAGQKVSEIDQEAFTSDIKNKFARTAKVERVIAAEGDNPITDYLGFGAAKPENKNQTWTTYLAFGEETIDQPEEVSDVKGAVVADYQAKLEKEWLEQLHKKYAVKINKKELKKAQK